MTDQRPHIVFIMADQLGAPALNAYGHPNVKTPNIDRLAAQGTVFEHPYCNSPLCSTSRVSLLSGRLASEFDAFDNATEFPAGVPTFMHYLRQHGYRTCLSGKMHLVGPDQLHGFEERLTTDFYPVDFGWTPDWENPHEHMDFFHNPQSITEAGICARSMPIDYDDEVTFRACRHIYDVARDPQDDRPLFLTVSLTHPHDPYTTTRDYWQRYSDDEIDLPRVPDLDGTPEDDPHSQRLRYNYGMHRVSLTDAQVRQARHAYYGMVSYLDDRVGDVLDALAKSGLGENTIVIFAADHGDMLGERGLWYKMSFYEWSAAVPFIIRHPEVAGGGRVDRVVSLMDLFPTLVDFATGAEPDPVVAPDLKGRSLRPLLFDHGADWPDLALSEYLGEGAAGPCLMVRKGRYKYVYSDGEADQPADPPQLFDVVADPQERTNLAGRRDMAAVERELADLVARYWDPDALRRRVLRSQKCRRFIFDALSKGKPQPWDYEPRWDAGNQYIRNDEGLPQREGRARLAEQAR